MTTEYSKIYLFIRPGDRVTFRHYYPRWPSVRPGIVGILRSIESLPGGAERYYIDDGGPHYYWYSKHGRMSLRLPVEAYGYPAFVGERQCLT